LKKGNKKWIGIGFIAALILLFSTVGNTFLCNVVNKRLSIIPAPFLIGMKGFLEKCWMYDEDTGISRDYINGNQGRRQNPIRTPLFLKS
jgi:hypothetical protein